MRNNLKAIILTGALMASVPALAQVVTTRREDDRNVYIAANGSFFFPTQGRLKDAFDDQIVFAGLSFAQNNLDYNWRVRPDFGVFNANRNGNRLLIVPVTASVSRIFAQPGDSFQPYVKLEGGIAYTDYAITDRATAIRTSGNKVLPTGGAEVGLILSQRVRVFASYHTYGKADGWDFSGFQIGAVFSLFRL